MTNSKIQLLIVEDDEDDYFLLEETLKKTSFDKEIYWATSFEKSKEFLLSKTFDLVLIDYRLGIHTGIEVISFINEYFPYTPSILLTGLKGAAIDKEALESGVYEYLSKDQYSAEGLDRSIRYAIEKSKVLKSLKESESKFKSLFENSVEYVFIIDASYAVVDANKSALRLFNFSAKEQIIGLNLSKYLPQDLFRRVRLPVSSLEVEVFIPELNKKRYCILNLSLVETEKTMYQIVLHDLTDRIENEQREKLLAKQALTGKVARVIAHEIKNPLTNIHLSLFELRSLLKDTKIQDEDSQPEEFLNIIERNGKRIQTLIEDLLNATRLDTITMSDLDFEDVLKGSLEQIKDRARLKNVKVEHSIASGLKLKGDREKLVIAISNILVNAIEAVEEGKGRLWVNAGSTGGAILVNIKDNGKGIPQSDIGNLFEPFFTSKKGGTGLGLTAAYNIMMKHDGIIKVESKEGEGSTFNLVFPLSS